MLKSILPALSLLVATPAVGQVLVGDEITRRSAPVVAELTRIADALDAAVDAKDWEGARALFADEVAVDFTGLTGGEPATIPADALIGGWSSNLTAAKTSFHLRGNHRVDFRGSDNAHMVSNGYAWNRLEEGALLENGGDPLWEVWGVYTHDFERIRGEWRITGMTFNPTAQRGNAYVRDTVID